MLSRRERQIMDLVYERDRATAAEIQAALPDPPSYSAIRATLRILEEKGHLRHEEVNQKYVFLPVVPKKKAKVPALRHLVDTFFEGRPERVVATLLDPSSGKISEEQLKEMAELIQRARQTKRQKSQETDFQETDSQETPSKERKVK